MYTMKLSNLNQLQTLLTQHPWVLVEFWSSGCGACQHQKISSDRIASRHRDNLSVARCNVDQHEDLAATYEVKSTPNFVLFREGKPLARLLGHQSEAGIETWLRSHIQPDSSSST